MADNLFSADQVIGKQLIANKRINVRKLAGTDAPVLYVAEAGQSVGTVYSWVKRGNEIWWQLDPRGFVQHNAGWYSIKALKDQGTITVKQQEEAKKEAEKSFTDKLGDFFSPTGTFLKYGIPIGIAVVGFMVIDRLIPSKKN
jgi:hypothetical protein